MLSFGASGAGRSGLRIPPAPTVSSNASSRSRSRRLLEIAAGTGRVTRHLLAALPADGELVATDLNEPMIAEGRLRLPNDPRLRWQTADAQAIPFGDGAFDVVA